MIPQYDPMTYIIYLWLRVFAWPIAVFFTVSILCRIISSVHYRYTVWHFDLLWHFEFTLAAAAWCWIIVNYL